MQDSCAATTRKDQRLQLISSTDCVLGPQQRPVRSVGNQGTGPLNGPKSWLVQKDFSLTQGSAMYRTQAIPSRFVIAPRVPNQRFDAMFPVCMRL